MSSIADLLEAAIPRGPVNIAAPASAADLRASLLKAAGMVAPEHPSLSWQVNMTLLGHRRAGEGVTACGRSGDLTVAVDPGVPPCPKCYPAE